MSRLFVAASSHEIQCVVSTAIDVGFGTFVAIARRVSNGNSNILRLVSSTPTNRLGLFFSATDLFGYSANTAPVAAALNFQTDDNWCLVAAGKATGNSTPRFCKHIYDTGVTAFANATTSSTDAIAPGTTGTFRIGNRSGGPFFDGDIAACAFFNRLLTDAEIERMIFGGLQSWIATLPEGLWVLDQGDSGQSVVDLTGNGANQSGGSVPGLSTVHPSFWNRGDDAWLVISAAAAAGDQTIEPSAIVSSEAFGTARLNLRLLMAAIVSGEAFGVPQLNLRLIMQTIASAEAFGTAKLNFRLVASAIASLEAFGSTTLTQAQVVLPGGITTAEAFGAAKLNFRLLMQAIASGEAFGVTSLDFRILASAIASLEAFGIPSLDFGIRPSGIGSLEAFGTSQLNLRLLMSAIASAEGFGTANVILSGSVQPTGISTQEAFGIAKLNLRLTMSGIASAEAFGQTVLNALQTILPGSIASGESFGTPQLNYRIISVGIATQETFGSPTLVQTGNQSILPSGIISGQAFGTTTVTLVLIVVPVLADECPSDWNLDVLDDITASAIASPEDESILSHSVVATPSDAAVTPSTGPWGDFHDWS